MWSKYENVTQEKQKQIIVDTSISEFEPSGARARREFGFGSLGTEDFKVPGTISCQEVSEPKRLYGVTEAQL